MQSLAGKILCECQFSRCTYIITTVLESRLSSRLVKAVMEDYVCLIAPQIESTLNKLSIEEACIFVPKAIADSTECGGVRLFENIKKITSDPDFCSKKIGW